MKKEITILTTLAVITVAWIGIYVSPAFDTDRPDSPPEPAPTPAPPSPDDPDTPDDPSEPTDNPDDLGEYEPAEPAYTGSEAMSVDAALSHPMIHPAGSDEFHAEFAFEATDEAPESRAPVNVSLVIDRSGSMRGEPMEYARRAARAFVKQLQPQDRVSLVSFDHEIVTEVESTHVDEEGEPMLLDAIDDIQVGGATNISGALHAGFEEVQAHQDPKMVDRVILMTDGIPNRGLTNDEELAAKTGEIRRSGVTTTALGYGSDYDAELLANMATEGAGNFAHIDDAQGFETAFAEELDDLRSTVASGIELDLRAAEGVQIKDVYGFSQDEIDDGTRISLGNLEADGHRSAVVELNADDQNTEPGALRDILDAEVNYIDRIEDEDQSRGLQLDSRTTGSIEDIDDHVVDEVMLRVEQHRSLQSLSEVREYRERGDEQAARERIDRERERLDEIRDSYDSGGSVGSDDDSGAMDRVRGLFDSAEEEVEAIEEDAAPAAAPAPSQDDEVQMELRQGRSN